ncbi:MAG: radical SAM protein [Nitrososphaeria archaeon]|nr:radical SAM protein [Conexivisphaerales archaeon]
MLVGDPLLLPLKQLTTIINEIKGYGMKPSLSTNGFALSMETARSLKKAGIIQVQLSVDGTSKEVNDFIRGPGSFKAVLNPADNVREEGLDFTTSVTLTSLKLSAGS